MADYLGRVLQAEDGLAADEVPRRVLRNANDFFRLALEAAGGQTPHNPGASLANYRIATDAVVRLVRPRLATTTDIANRLRAYAKFVRDISESGKSMPDRQMVEQVRNFFAQLARLGADETYTETVRLEPPSFDEITNPGAL
ncbi:MAG: hypothetical protein IT379_14715 [Deltaproteobacteria bacterium]|nr:hypothetical protein [Deltaproteobacteria bacterium]